MHYMEKIGVGIIGAGVRGVYCLGDAIAVLEERTDLTVCGIYDIIEQRSVESKRYLEGVYSGQGMAKDIRVYHDFEEMLNDDVCRIVIVTNFTDQHRSYTIRALDAGKKVYLDKPISVTRNDAAAIVDAAEDNPLIMGFTRRYEKSWIKAKSLLDDGVIGPLQMIEINSIIPYSRYLQTWHRKKELSGGALNDKSSHHFDVFNWMAGEYPTYLTAVGGRSSVFPVDPNAPESCRVCDRDCPYRRDSTKISDGAFVLQLDSWNNADDEVEKIDTCVYAPGGGYQRSRDRFDRLSLRGQGVAVLLRSSVRIQRIRKRSPSSVSGARSRSLTARGHS